MTTKKITLAEIKQEAKKLQQDLGCKLNEAQHRIANKYNCKNYQILKRKIDNNNGFLDVKFTNQEKTVRVLNTGLSHNATGREKLELILDKIPVLTQLNTRIYKENASIEDHEYLFDHIEEFEKACIWLKSIDKIKSINKRHTSYGLKHIVERAINFYISNDAFIAAAVYSGFDVKLIDDSPNVLFNISEKSIKNFSKQ